MSKTKKGGSGFSSAKQPVAPPNHQITRNKPDHGAKEQQAAALINQGKPQEAEAIYRELIADGTSNHAVFGNLAAICGTQGRIDEAITLIGKSLDLEPDNPDALNNLGLALNQNGKLKEAIAYHRRATELKPNCPNFHFNLGLAFDKEGDTASAIASYRKTIELQPSYPEAHNALGNALKEQGDFAAAITSYNNAIELNPNYRDAYTNLGVALQEEGNLEGAIEALTTALRIDETHSATQWNLSIALLRNGNYKQGWNYYETRKSIWKHNTQNPLPEERKWSNRSKSLPTKILLLSEQGLGDTLQFMRYIHEMKNRGIKTSLCAPTKLHSLIKASGIDASPISPDGACLNEHEMWLPLLSLPSRLGVSPKTPITTGPYIKTTQAITVKWRNLLSGERKPVIGINWQGDQNTERIFLRGRSLPVETFAPVAQTTNASLLSLQKGFGSEQLETCSFRDRFVSCQPQVDETWDFLETAAIIANCDLVITSDTSVAHLAGGMGKKTWLLLQKVPEWRWGLKGETTFWYPSMRLFRQRERGDWDEVLQRVAEALQEEFPGISTADR